MKKILFCAVVSAFMLSACRPGSCDNTLRMAEFSEVRVGGELKDRIHRNFDRMEDELYQPARVFKTAEESGWWPGDTEGRAVLAIVMDAQATGREPKYLEEILTLFPDKVNEQGYFGYVPPESFVDEQQLSSHGWVFRALCEYYLWTKDERALDYLNPMLDNLALPTKGFHDNYPIDPEERVHAGGAIGTRYEKTMNNWILSTDIGCDFVFLDGLIQAYEVTGREDLKPIVDEIVSLYKRIDVEAIKAQTHSSLTGARAMLRYYNMTGDESLLQVAKKCYDAYAARAMTENYENFNWFGRPEWTEPCAVLDSYMVAVQLWQHTGNPVYLSDAQKIYYNGICFDQRANGGFGTSQCSGSNDHKDVMVSAHEAPHCCSMRGGEGLSSAARYTAFVKGNEVLLTNFVTGDYALRLADGRTAQFAVATDYPFANGAKVVFGSDVRNIRLSFFNPEWVTDIYFTLNGKAVEATSENGFVTLAASFAKGDELDVSFAQVAQAYVPENPNSMQGVHKYRVGPLLLGVKDGNINGLPFEAEIAQIGRRAFMVGNQPMTTVYHFMDPEVAGWPHPGEPYRIQILFEE